MVTSDIVIIGITMLFLYLVIYKTNKFFGNIGFAACGLAMMYYSVDHINTAMGLMILLASFINLVYHTLGVFTNKRKTWKSY